MRYIIVLKCQRSTAAWSSSSCLRNCALQGVQEENSREASCNLGVLWSCVPSLNCVRPWTAWEKAVVSPDISRMHWFLHVQIFEMCDFRSCCIQTRDAVFYGRVPNLPRLLAKDSLKKGRAICCSDVFAVMSFFVHDRVPFTCGFWVGGLGVSYKPLSWSNMFVNFWFN